MRNTILLIIAMLAIQAISTKTTRRMQSVQPTADTGNHGTASGSASTNGNNTTVTFKIFGGVWNLTWDKWVWGVVFMVLGLVLCIFTLMWWKFLRIPMGGLIGFFCALSILMYAINPYVADPSATGWKVLWYCMVTVLAIVGVVLFWKCPNLSVGATCAWLLYMCGLQVVSIIEQSMDNQMSTIWSLVIVIAFAAGGFFLGCYFPNFTIIAGTAFAGAYLAVVGLGIMTGQYPTPGTSVAGWVWWMYFVGQWVLGVVGFMFQWCVSYKKHNHRVRDDEQSHLESHEQVEVHAQVEVRI